MEAPIPLKSLDSKVIYEDFCTLDLDEMLNLTTPFKKDQN